MESPVSVIRQQVTEAAAKESLCWQTIALESALGDAADALATKKGMHCLVRRRADLEAAMTKYEEVFISHQQAADANGCAAAEKVRRILRDSSDEALDLLETLIEEKVKEKASIIEVEDEICGAKAEVVTEMVAMELVDDFCAEVVVEGIRTAEVEVGICTAEVEAEWIAIKPLVDPGEQAVKVVVQCINKDEVLLSGGLDPGEGVRHINVKNKLEQELGLKEWVAAKEALDAGKVGKVVVECANKGELLRSGDLDPGEEAGLGMEVKQSRLKVKQHLAGMVCGKFEVEEPRIAKDGLKFCATKDVEFEMQDVEFEVQRFVTAGCRAQGTNSEYG